MYHEKTAFAARGKWKGILAQLGMDMSYLSGKHGPCPICKDGQDRFRFDNREQRGTWICNVCGAGDGMDLVMKAWGFDFKEAASRIDAIVGNAKDDPKPKPELTQDQVRNAMMNVWRNSVQAAPGDLVHRYLASRHIDEVIYPKALRFAKALTDGDGGIRPCMVAMVTEASGEKVVQMHRTFLKPDGSGKAEMQAPRKLLPGELPEGCAIRLSEYNGHGALGIAEGIETAMSASAMFDLPVWAAISAGNLAKWEPPAGCTEVAIFGDNDPKFAGQAASYALARRLASKGFAVTVHIPLIAGADWADEWMATRRKVRMTA